MNFKRFARAITSCFAAALLCVGIAHADTVTGSVYTTTPFPAPLSPLETPPGTLLGTFTTNNITLFSPGGASYTVGGFLASGGATVTGLSSAVASMTLNNKELKFVGTTFLQGGVVYSVTHDDGAFLYLNGVQVLGAGSGNPTDPKTDTFSVATTGAYSFDLLYAEVNNSPATLNFTGPLATPEPSSFVLLGSGLIAAAGAVRRRLFA
ncbi:MAG: hypothetical protein NVSMB3_03280 [Acidobacteriaceae bacterium]